MKRNPPLWRAADQSERLAELTANRSEPIREAPLRRDVRSLGTLLGRVLMEQAGLALFETVEKLRRLLIEHREKASTASNGDDARLLADAKSAVAALTFRPLTG